MVTSISMPPHRRSQPEPRLADLLKRLKAGISPVDQLAAELGISKQTLSKCIRTLRERGHDIRTIRGPEGWEYKYEKGT